jgi:hypothetical protein
MPNTSNDSTKPIVISENGQQNQQGGNPKPEQGDQKPGSPPQQK